MHELGPEFDRKIRECPVRACAPTNAVTGFNDNDTVPAIAQIAGSCQALYARANDYDLLNHFTPYRFRTKLRRPS